MLNQLNSLIIIDWDDTLFPTSWFNSIDKSLIKTKYKHIFDKLDNVLYKFLSLASIYGKIIIVTNATLKWINISSGLLEKTNKLLPTFKIVSARDNHYKTSNNIYEWKKKSFKDQVKEELDNHNYANIISIGDADYEYTALIELYDHMHDKTKLLKAIKLLEHPNLEQLFDQLNVLHNNIINVVTSTKNLDLTFNSLK